MKLDRSGLVQNLISYSLHARLFLGQHWTSPAAYWPPPTCS